MMTLDQYLTHEKLSNDAFAALLSAHIGREIHRVTVGQYRRGQRIPQPSFMIAIYIATGGAVRPDSFYDLPDLASSACAARPGLARLAGESEAA